MYHSLLLRAISDGGQKYIWYLDRPLNSCWNQLRSTTGSWLTWYPFPNPMNPKTKTKTRGAFIFSATFKMTVTESLPSKRFYRHTCGLPCMKHWRKAGCHRIRLMMQVNFFILHLFCLKISMYISASSKLTPIVLGIVIIIHDQW